MRLDQVSNKHLVLSFFIKNWHSDMGGIRYISLWVNRKMPRLEQICGNGGGGSTTFSKLIDLKCTQQ